MYDDSNGALPAARAWWMLRWLGHERVAVLDGGWQRWTKETCGQTAEVPVIHPCEFKLCLHPEMQVGLKDVDRLRLDPAYHVYDSRAEERYHGRNETIYPVPGHIPGALSAPYMDNLTAEGVFKSEEDLRQRFTKLFGELPAEQNIFYCGSGVTAAHNILAAMRAGLGQARLYVGSWSEWIADPSRPVAT